MDKFEVGISYKLGGSRGWIGIHHEGGSGLPLLVALVGVLATVAYGAGWM